jgi:hypothetical protein
MGSLSSPVILSEAQNLCISYLMPLRHMNYFNYFTEIEDRFQHRRGSLLMLSTLDWALIETWREAGVPLEAVLRGIDDAFDKHDAQRLRSTRRQRKVNGLAWCAQAVLQAVEQSREAAIGAAPAASEPRESGFDAARIARYLERNAVLLAASAASLPAPANTAAAETATRLRELASRMSASGDVLSSPSLLSSRSAAEGSASLSNLEPRTLNLEDLDRTLTVLEEKLFAALLTATPESELVALREHAARELAPFRGKMQAVQIKQVQQQFLQKRLLEANALPRLSLFYMPHEDETPEAC